MADEETRTTDDTTDPSTDDGKKTVPYEVFKKTNQLLRERERELQEARQAKADSEAHKAHAEKLAKDLFRERVRGEALAQGIRDKRFADLIPIEGLEDKPEVIREVVAKSVEQDSHWYDRRGRGGAGGGDAPRTSEQRPSGDARSGAKYTPAELKQFGLTQEDVDILDGARTEDGRYRLADVEFKK